MANQVVKSSTTPEKKPNISSKKMRTALQSVVKSKGNVHVISNGDGWAVKREGTTRATRVYLAQSTALSKAKEIVKKSGSYVVVHRKDGKIKNMLSRNSSTGQFIPVKDTAEQKRTAIVGKPNTRSKSTG